MSETPINRLIGRLQSHGCNPRETGSGQWKSRCPAHKGRSSNLSVKQADDGAVILHCHHVDATGQTYSAEAIVRSLGLEMRDLFPDRLGLPSGKPKAAPTASRNGNGKAWRSPEEAIAWHAKTVKGQVSERGPWIYNDPDHFELMRVYRIDYCDPETGEPRKQFRPVYPDAAGWHVGDPSKDRLPLYHLEELTAAGLVYVCEGEKCADLVRGLGLVTTTSSHGAQSPGKTDWSPLAGKTVVILPDHDGSGESYAIAVAGILAGLDPRPIIKVVRLPLAGEGDDIEQWLEAVPDAWGPDECRAELERIAEATPEWMPPAEAPEGDDVRDPIGDIDPKAFHGVLGRLALGTQKETEANPVFVFMHLLGFFGAAVGRSPHFVISATRIYMNIFMGLIGPSGYSRKGTAGFVAKAIWQKVDPLFARDNITDGLNSGAGLLYHLRDASTKLGKNGQPISDPGVTDKRRVFLEEEYSSVLKQGHRENETLLEYIRKAADGQDIIRSNTKDPVTVTGAHVSVIGHCTPADLTTNLSDSDKHNGTANRNLWFFGVKSKILPRGGDVFALLDSGALDADLKELREAIDFAKGVGIMRRSPAAEAKWAEIYRGFQDVPPGRLGALFVRAAPQVMKLASNLALLDRSRIVEVVHLEAALAIWDHSSRALRWIFRADVDKNSEKIIEALKAAPDGMTKKQILEDVFKRNLKAAAVDELLRTLLAHRTILKRDPIPGTRGRPAPRFVLNDWRA
jgi:hypothetical protein